MDLRFAWGNGPWLRLPPAACQGHFSVPRLNSAHCASARGRPARAGFEAVAPSTYGCAKVYRACPRACRRIRGALDLIEVRVVD